MRNKPGVNRITMRLLIALTVVCAMHLCVMEAGAGGLFDNKRKGLVVDFGIGAGLSAFGYNEFVNDLQLNAATDAYTGITFLGALNIGYIFNDVFGIALGEQLTISKHESMYNESAVFIDGLLGPLALIDLKKSKYLPYCKVGAGFSHHKEGKEDFYHEWYGFGAHASFGYVIRRFFSLEAKVQYSLNYRDVKFFYSSDSDYGYRWMYWDTKTKLETARGEAMFLYQNLGYTSVEVQEILDTYILDTGHIRIGSFKIGIVFSVPIF